VEFSRPREERAVRTLLRAGQLEVVES
jgi:hypothetical protein